MGEEQGKPNGLPAGQLLPAGAFGPLLVALIAAAWLSFTPALFNDGDTSWHLATGRWILQHQAIPHTDPFSFTFRGQPWTAHEWLVEVIMALVHQVAGWGGVALLFSLAASAALLLIGRELALWLPWQRALLLLVCLLAVLAPFLLARPHVIAWPLLAAWTIGLLRARDRDQAPPIALALLILLWANLHASFIFGLFLGAVFALEALFASPDRKRALLSWSLFGALSLLCGLLTPHGVEAFLYPFQVSGMKALPLIQEWRPTSVTDDWVFLLFACAVAVLAALRWRDLLPIRLPLLGLLALLALLQARHQALFAIVSLLVLARSVPPPARAVQKPSPMPWGLLAGATALLAVVRLAAPLTRGDLPTYPATALSKLPDRSKATPVFNSYSFGGPLILHGIAPYIDGRADMYGDEHTFRHQAIVEGDLAALEQSRARWGIGWTILHPNEPLVRKLDEDPKWKRAYADAYAVLHVRR